MHQGHHADHFAMFEDFNRDGFYAGFGGGFRASRGSLEPAILRILAEKPMHGYEIISTFEERSQGMWRPSPGSVYPTLQLLEEKGYVHCQEEDGKKVYHLTEDGKKAAAETPDDDAWQERMAEFGNAHDARHTLHETMHLMRRIYRKGSDHQKQQLVALVMRLQHDVKRIAEEEK